MPSLLPTRKGGATVAVSNGRKSSATSKGRTRKRPTSSASTGTPGGLSYKRTVRLLQCLVLPCLSVILIGFQLYTFILPYYLPSMADTLPLLGGSLGSLATGQVGSQRLATSHRQVLRDMEQAKLTDSKQTHQALQKVLANHQHQNPSNNGTSFHSKRRQLPHTKIVYLLHIHKSAGTSLCQLARYNGLSTSVTNCNVQRDQRCCGKDDSLQAQQLYYETSPHDFVASEGRMYEAMDPTHYRYIVVLRRSQERYFSHWKHARRTHLALPNRRRDDEIPRVAAGGMLQVPHGIHLEKPKEAHLTVDERQEEAHNHMMDLVRDTKQERHARRQAKFKLMEEWQKEKAIEHHVGEHATNKALKLIAKPKEEVVVADFAVEANKNTAQLFFPKRRRRLQQVKPPPIIPHPAEDPTLPFKEMTQPLVGDRFADWWNQQPDNWNFRQLCGTRCQGIPKYQLSLQDWAYTLERFLQFDTVLFLEELQQSVTVLTSRLNWNQSSLDTIQQLQAEEEARKAIQKEAARRKKKDGVEPSREALHQWYVEAKAQQMEQKQRHNYFHDYVATKEQMEDWDPLMSALDDALYDIGKRWEQLKIDKHKTTDELTPDELMPLVDIASLSTEAIQGAFQWYMEEAAGNHRTQCHNECCAVQCSAW